MNKNRGMNKRKLALLLMVVFLLAIIVETAITLFVIDRDIKQSTQLFINQVESVLKDNKNDVELQLEELKDVYIVSADAAAYIIDSKPSITSDTEELKKIAKLLSVDELHIFDSTGKIIGGTNPEYFGYSFDSGDQIAYFKPMLEDKTLSMCQDVTPNTAASKSMMYAITWDKSGTYMIQVGVEPKRLLEMMKNTEMKSVISAVPLIEGYNIYSVDPSENKFVASTKESKIGKEVPDSIVSIYSLSGESTGSRYVRYDNTWQLVKYQYVDNNLILVTYDTKESLDSFIVPLRIISIYLLIAELVFVRLFYKFQKVEESKNEAVMKQYKLLKSIADIYYSMHVINLEEDTVEEYNGQGEVKEIVSKQSDACKMMRQVITTVTTDEFVDDALEFTELSTVADRMIGKKIIAAEFLGKNIGWYRAVFIATESNENDKPVKVIFATRSIDDEKKKEETLVQKSTTDELTGAYNRRAYEDKIKELSIAGIDEDFVYVSIDVNGLKVVNDTIGHVAGDELIIGATFCLKECLGPYGEVYRTGGDEFIALMNAKEEKVENIFGELDNATDKWHGEFVEHLSMSYGYVKANEQENFTIKEMALLADKRMYDAKSKHYKSKGVDRRGQKDAHIALCSLYTKILKINLTNDSYDIVNVDPDEQIEEKGYSDKISLWLKRFGETGQVHPDDLEEYFEKTRLEYLKDYFTKEKTSLHILYRRKMGDEFKQVMMEIIPANDYAEGDQNCFLYVKSIDK